LEHLGSGAIRGCQHDRQALIELQAKIVGLQSDIEKKQSDISRQKSSMIAEEKQASQMGGWITNVDANLSEGQACSTMLGMTLDEAIMSDESPGDTKDLFDADQCEARERMKADLTRKVEKMSALVNKNKDAATLGKQLKDTINHAKKCETDRKAAVVKTVGAKRRALQAVFDDVEDIRDHRKLIRDELRGAVTSDVTIEAGIGNVSLVFAPSPPSSHPVLWEAVSREGLSERPLLIDPPQPLFGQRVVKVNGKPVGTSQAEVTAAVEAVHGPLTLTLEPMDSEYALQWRALWEPVLEALEAPLDKVPHAKPGAQIDDAFRKFASAFTASYFKGADTDNISAAQKDHTTRLQEATTKISDKIANRALSHAESLVATINKQLHSGAHSDPVGGWQVALVTAAQTLAGRWAKVLEWESECNRETVESPDRGSMTGSGDEEHVGRYCVANLQLSEIEEMQKEVADIRAITSVLVEAFKGRLAAEKVWATMMWGYANQVGLDAVRGKDGHYAGKHFADVVNGITRNHNQSVEDTDCVKKLTSDNSSLSTANAGLARDHKELTAKESTMTKQRDKLDEEVKNQCKCCVQ